MTNTIQKVSRGNSAHAPEPRPADAALPSVRPLLESLDHDQGAHLLKWFQTTRGDAAARAALVSHYQLCAQIVARQVYRSLGADARRTIDLADAEQTSLCLLHTLLERFDASRGVPLSAFLMMRLPLAMIDEFRHLGIVARKDRDARTPLVVSIDLETARLAGRSRQRALVDPRPLPCEQVQRRHFRGDVLEHVPEKHRLFVALRFFRGLQLWQVARRLHITYARAADIEREVSAQLTEHLDIRNRTALPAKRPAKPRGKMSFTLHVVPPALRGDKAFRRWAVLQVPWAYRRFIAYHHLRGVDLPGTAARLGISLHRAQEMQRHARPMIVRAVKQFGQEQLRARAASPGPKITLAA